MIGTQIPGSIEKQECEPYEYVVQETGEEIILSHRWVYLPEGTDKLFSTAKDELKPETDVFSKNGSLENAFV